MTTEQAILRTLDHANDGYYCHFIPLNHPYSYLIDTRLNLFRCEKEWAVVAEILGYNPRGGYIELQLFCYGNCLINLEQYNQRNTNSYAVYPIDMQSYEAALRDELLAPEAQELVVRGVSVALSHDKQEYERAGIELVELETGSVSMEKVGRLLVEKHRALFRATDAELRKSIPAHLEKILVLDEWHHKDFTVAAPPPETMSDEAIARSYATNQQAGALANMPLDDLQAAVRAQEERSMRYAMQEWESSRPSSYETWQQLAKVLATGEPRHYQPSLPANTHWSNWPDSGSL